MKKLFAILAVSAILTACNDTETDSAYDSDSATAAATADSINAANAMTADTSTRSTDSITVNKADSSLNTSSDSLKK